MAVPGNRQELIDAIESNFERLFTDLKALPEDVALNSVMEGHAKNTQMSIADLVSYLLGWNELVLKWLDRDAAGEVVDFPEAGFAWNELGRLAQKFYGDYAGIAWPQRLERLQAAKARIVCFIEAQDNAALYERPWYGKWPMGRMIQFNTSSPFANARKRLRAWLKANPRLNER